MTKPIICKAADNAYMDEDYDWEAHRQFIEKLKSEGWIEVPNDFPSGIFPKTYSYQYPGLCESWMKPKPKLRHWLYVKTINSLHIWWYFRRQRRFYARRGQK